MVVHNSLTKTLESLPKQKSISIYSCGPTVYDYAHIGNMRTFLFEDLLIRTLLFLGYEVKHVRNITDVDDKIIERSRSQNISLKEFTEKYTEIFFQGLKDLRFNQEHTTYLKATEYISEMVALIQELVDKGFAYEQQEGVYFKISSFKEYGNFAHLDLENIKKISDDLEFHKENGHDFVLWKKHKVEDGDIYWESPWGKGRPGWHTECAAMVRESFPEGLDIHTGGIDLLFPHHTNEKAHCECLSNKPMAKFWIHATHLLVDNKKMSKSDNNFYTIKDLQDKGFSFKTIRFYLQTGAHFQTPLNFTLEGLAGAESALKRINNFIYELENSPTEGESISLKENFKKHLEQNLNISASMGEIFTTINNFYTGLAVNSAEILADLKEINKILDVFDFETNNLLPKDIEDLYKQRIQAREQKNWAESDRLRDLLLELGYEVRDTKNESSIRKL